MGNARPPNTVHPCLWLARRELHPAATRPIRCLHRGAGRGAMKLHTLLPQAMQALLEDLRRAPKVVARPLLDLLAG